MSGAEERIKALLSKAMATTIQVYGKDGQEAIEFLDDLMQSELEVLENERRLLPAGTFPHVKGPWMAIPADTAQEDTACMFHVDYFDDRAEESCMIAMVTADDMPEFVTQETLRATAELLSMGPEMLASLVELTETFDCNRQAIYKFAQQRLDRAKKLVERAKRRKD